MLNGGHGGGVSRTSKGKRPAILGVDGNLQYDPQCERHDPGWWCVEATDGMLRNELEIIQPCGHAVR